MELDFSWMNKTNKPQNDAVQAVYTESLVITAEREENALESQIGALEAIPEKEAKRYYKLERAEEEQERMRLAYAEYQDHILKSGTLRSDINKGINAGKDMKQILLQAIECISCMTGDSLFYQSNREKIERNYK